MLLIRPHLLFLAVIRRLPKPTARLGGMTVLNHTRCWGFVFLWIGVSGVWAQW